MLAWKKWKKIKKLWNDKTIFWGQITKLTINK